MSRYIDADKLKKHYMWWGGGFTANCKDGQKEVKKIFDEIIDLQPTADVVEVGKWCDMREYILEMQADENGHNEFFRIIKLDDELKERVANEIELAFLYGVER